MLKKTSSGVLASLKGSTNRSVRLASSLAAALLEGFFEHPGGAPVIMKPRPVMVVVGLVAVVVICAAVLLDGGFTSVSAQNVTG